MFPTLVQSPTVHAKGQDFLKHDLTTDGFSLIFAQSSSFKATCSSFPELLTHSTERIEIPFPQLLEHFCQGPLHHLKRMISENVTRTHYLTCKLDRRLSFVDTLDSFTLKNWQKWYCESFFFFFENHVTLI